MDEYFIEQIVEELPYFVKSQDGDYYRTTVESEYKLENPLIEWHDRRDEEASIENGDKYRYVGNICSPDYNAVCNVIQLMKDNNYKVSAITKCKRVVEYSIRKISEHHMGIRKLVMNPQLQYVDYTVSWYPLKIQNGVLTPTNCVELPRDADAYYNFENIATIEHPWYKIPASEFTSSNPLLLYAFNSCTLNVIDIHKPVKVTYRCCRPDIRKILIKHITDDTWINRYKSFINDNNIEQQYYRYNWD